MAGSALATGVVARARGKAPKGHRAKVPSGPPAGGNGTSSAAVIGVHGNPRTGGAAQTGHGVDYGVFLILIFWDLTFIIPSR